MEIDDFYKQFKKLPLGLKNNNPGNLRSSKCQWNGKIGSKNGFCQFSDFKYGVRAMCFVLCKYIFSYHLFQIYDICNRYAPQCDGNDPKKYTDFVMDKCGFSAMSFNIPTLNIQFPLLVYAMMCIELGDEFRIKSREFQGFTSYLFALVDHYFHEYLNNVYYPVYGKITNICV